MKWSLKLGTVAGIGIFVHWTFLLLVGWILFLHLSHGQSLLSALIGVGFVLALFACVVLHELGHALTARRYHIRTRDITLLPIGGLARLERIPENPTQELWVALAGPAVNLILFLGLFLFIGGLTNLSQTVAAKVVRGDFLVRLMWVNLFLAGFNLLPAFPMDGGRVLRALLARRMGRRRATAIAASVGQAMAIGFGIIGFWWNPFLIFIAIFVYLGAQAEAQMVGIQTAIKGLTVQDAMLTRFRTLSAVDVLDAAIQELLAGSQHDFPVMDGDKVVGVLRRNDLVKALAHGGRETKISSAMQPGCRAVHPEDPLEQAFETLRRERCQTSPVVSGGRLVGLLTLENIAELMMVNAALGEGRYTRHADVAEAHAER
jgi:Zn-dependent protease/CBS domain-containing protein